MQTKKREITSSQKKPAASVKQPEEVSKKNGNALDAFFQQKKDKRPNEGITIQSSKKQPTTGEENADLKDLDVVKKKQRVIEPVLAWSDYEEPFDGNAVIPNGPVAFANSLGTAPDNMRVGREVSSK